MEGSVVVKDDATHRRKQKNPSRYTHAESVKRGSTAKQLCGKLQVLEDNQLLSDTRSADAETQYPLSGCDWLALSSMASPRTNHTPRAALQTNCIQYVCTRLQHIHDWRICVASVVQHGKSPDESHSQGSIANQFF